MTIFYSPTIGKVAAALAKAQQEMGKAVKDSNNPAFKSKYADLTSCLDAVTAALNKHDIAVMQLPEGHSGHISLTTLLTHSSGEYIGSTDSLPRNPNARNPAHEHGSTLTYLRRYGIAAVCGLGQEDDDGNSITKAPKVVDTSKAEAALTEAAKVGYDEFAEAWKNTAPEIREAIKPEVIQGLKKLCQPEAS
jgi:hypothetical protein